jgi:ATP-dependent DNA helicase RecQ
MRKAVTNHQINIQQVAKERFGYEALRPGQETAVEAVLKGHDTLVVMPTGSGKSAIYQIAAYLIPGATVVVSPLIALQRDQVEAIAHQDIGEAAAVNATLASSKRQETFAQLEEGNLEFIFLAPEQFNLPETLARLEAAKPSLFVVDEAHCISSWGHDFRPDYLRLGQVVEALGHPRILALTATAAPPVRAEIVERLGMRNALTLVQGFDRPNITLKTMRFETEEEKQASLLAHVIQAEKPGIVYVATRKRTEELAKQFQAEGIRSLSYHAGMKATDREATQTAFMQDEVDVLVATIAFGMGVDKPNVRFVFHADISDSLDSYYQEIGRVGRDQAPAQAVLFYNPKDLNRRRFFSKTGQINPTNLEQTLHLLQKYAEPVALKELYRKTDLSQSKLRSAIRYLSELEVIETTTIGKVYLTEMPDLETVTTAAIESQERRQQFERSRLEMMRSYAELRNCRREYLLNYFGEKFSAPCDNCDNCINAASTASANVTNGHQPYPLDSRVSHAAWGEGTVMRYENNKIVILFDQVGYKTLDIQTALLRKLLSRV